jgi:phosphoribosyl 1,2-cyclic phosphate phosphodiesterase
MMTITLLGTGNSTGVPAIQCKCNVCRSRHPKNKRLRCSAWIRVRGKNILIDTSPDLRQQALKARIPRIDAVFYTHPHADHIHGIDELRSFNFHQKAPIPVFGNDWTCRELRSKFSYSFLEAGSSNQPKLGGGAPRLLLNPFNASVPCLDLQGEKIIPISLSHGPKESVGYRIDSIAYLTDCSYIPPSSLDRMKGLRVLVLDCLSLAPHSTHFNLDQALETISTVQPRKTYLTHLGHEIDYVIWKRKLPKGVYLAYDGLTINV